MLMHAIAHRGCTDTVRESALEFDSRRKTPGPQTRISTAPGFSVRCSTSWALLCPNGVPNLTLSSVTRHDGDLPTSLTVVDSDKLSHKVFLSISFTAHSREKRSWKLTECITGCTIIATPQEQFLLEFYRGPFDT